MMVSGLISQNNFFFFAIAVMLYEFEDEVYTLLIKSQTLSICWLSPSPSLCSKKALSGQTLNSSYKN